MAGRRQDLETRLIAKDDASKVIDKVAGELDALEKRDTTIELDADDQASPEIRSLSQLLAGLSDEDKTIVLNAKAQNAERTIAGILRSLTRVDQMDDQDIEVRVTALGDARAELDRIQAELRDIDGTTADVDVDVEARGLDDVMDKLGQIPGLAGEVASSLGPQGAIAGGLAALVTAAVNVANEFATAATEVRTMSQLTGATSEEASRLQAVWKTTGADINDLNDVILQMIGVLESSPELAAQLGVNIQDGATGVERFTEVMEKLRDFTGDASERAVLLSKLLGEEGARQGAKLLAVVDDIDAAMGRVSEGQVISDEELAKAEDVAKRSAEVAAAWEAVKLDLGEIVAGPMADFLGQVTGTLSGLSALVSGEAFKPEFWEGARQGGTDLLGIADEGLRKEQERRRNADEVNDAVRAAIDLAKRRGRVEEDAAARLAIAQGRQTGGLIAKQEQLTKEEQARLALAQSRLIAYRDVLVAQAETNELALEFAAAMEEAAINVANAEGDMLDLAGTFEQLGTRQDAISALFDLKNAPLDAKGEIRDIELAIRDLSDVAEGIDLSKGLDRLKADPLLDAIDGLRPQIQAKITDAFSTGGADAARVMALEYIAQVAAELGISSLDAATLLGLEDLEALIHVAIEQTSLANAQAQLNILTGLGGETPLTASIALALQAGTITPRQAQLLVQDALRDAGVEVPAELAVTGAKPGALARAQRALQGEADENPTEQKINPTAPTKAELEAALAIVQDFYDQNQAILPVKPVIGDYVYPPGLIPGGGGGGGGGGGSGLLSATPMAAGAVPMAGPTLPTLMLPVAAPRAATVQPLIVHQTINAGGGRRPVRRRPGDGRRHPPGGPDHAEEPVMAAPAFEFTDRATPIVQMGRVRAPHSATLWGTAQWGVARWGGGGLGAGDLDRPDL